MSGKIANRFMCSTRLAFVGDIMPGGILNKTENQFITEELQNILNSHDIRIGTLECAIGDDFAFDPEKMSRKQDIVYAENDDLKRLKDIDINIVSLANNHIYDLGHDGLLNTINQLDKLNILHCGAGKNIEEASKPAVVTINGKTYAFIGFCDNKEYSVGYVPFATKEHSGVNPLYPESYAINEVRKYKKIYDFVYVLPHWGVEHTWFPRYYTISLTRKLISAGADGVIGGHPHRVQPLYIYKNRCSSLSMGNFMFFDRYINTPRPTFYPPKGSDTSKYPITDVYPYVSEPTLKIWKPLSRIGAIMTINNTSGGKSSAKYIFTELTSNNILTLLCGTNASAISKKLSRIQVAITYLLPIYRFIFATKIFLGTIKRAF